MRYVQLRAFHYVATCGGFSRAAEALFLTQPAISDQVRKLEDEYDVILFNRHKRQVSLTRAGERLLKITRKLFEVENQALELLSESRALRSGLLRIVADSANHLSKILGRFRERYPGIELILQAGNSEEVLNKLYNYEADVGVLGGFRDNHDFEAVRLNSSPLIAFAAAGHPLAGRPSIPLADLVAEALVLREHGSKTRQKFEDEAAKRGLRVTVAIEAEGREAVREIVAAGSGVGVVSRAEFLSQSGLVPIEIADCPIMMDEDLVCLKDRISGKLIRAFLDVAREEASAPART